MSDVREQRPGIVPEACERPQAVGDGGDAVVAARDLTRRYGSGDAAVDALRGISLDLAARALHGDHGPLRIRQVDPDARSGRARRAHQRHRAHRRRRDHHAQGTPAHPASSRQGRLHLPDLQPAADAHRSGEPRAASDHRRTQDRRRLARHPGARRRPGRSPRPSSGGAVGRPAAARRHRPGAGEPPGRDLRRRTHRQPRLQDRRRSARPAAPFGRRVRPDHRHGHPRRPGRHRGRSHRLSAGRTRRARLRAHEPRRDLRHHQVARGHLERGDGGPAR